MNDIKSMQLTDFAIDAAAVGDCSVTGTESDPAFAIIINQARHAAMEEILGVIAHKWRQPLNSIALIIQNMVDASKFGEMNDELLERSVFLAMEQINLLSSTIDDFRSMLDQEV